MTDYSYNSEPQNSNTSNGTAIASLVLGIVSIIAACFSPLVSLIAAIIGIVLANNSKKNFGPSGLAKAGMICSIIGIVLAVLMVILGIVAAGFLVGLGLMG